MKTCKCSLIRNSLFCILFSVGFTNDSRINDILIQEYIEYRDIIRIPLLENYRRLAHKSVLTFQMISQINGSFEYVLKMDDDMFPHIPRILKLTEFLNPNEVYVGNLGVGFKPIRDTKDKYYVSYEEFDGDSYKPIILGAGYILKKSVISSFKNIVVSEIKLPLEDVYVSYHMRNQGYPLTNHSLFAVCYHIFRCPELYIFSLGHNMRQRITGLNKLKKILNLY